MACIVVPATRPAETQFSRNFCSRRRVKACVRTIRFGAVALLTLLVTGLLAGGASATSCIAPAGPKDTITGTDDRSMGGTFFDQYDGAILGTVSSVRTVAQVPAGGTRITVDLFGAIGMPAVGSTMVLTADDEGGMNGFPFTPGSSYFIPIQDTGPQGQVNYSFVCDPIGEIAGADEAEALLAAARDEGHPVALPGNGAQVEPDARPAGGDSAGSASGLSWTWAAGGATAALAMVLGAVLVMRRRRPA